MRPLVFILALGISLSASSAAGQQNQFEQQVRQQLNKIGTNLESKGFELTHQVHTGGLKQGANEGVTVRLESGVKYALVGVCDEDCKDLDLRLFDSARREVAQDVGEDDVPVVEIQAQKSGEYTVRVEMAACVEEPCAYGIGVFASGQDEFTTQVQQQIEQAGRDLEQKGFELTHQIFTGALKEGQLEDVRFELERGGTYVVLGVCDNDCKDLDLRLVNSAGKEIDSDVQEDDAPVVAVTPARNESYIVKAVMADCTQGPCRYGLGVFRK